LWESGAGDAERWKAQGVVETDPGTIAEMERKTSAKPFDGSQTSWTTATPGAGVWV